MKKNTTNRVKNSTYRVIVSTGLKIVHIAKSSTYKVKKYKRTLYLGHLWPYLSKIGPIRLF